MVTEVRQIIFDNDEVIEALVEFQKHRKHPLPQGTIVDVTFGTEPQARCALNWIPAGGQERRTRIFSADELGAALIHYCIRQRIPLPAKSPKVLQAFDDRIGLKVTILGEKKAKSRP